MLTSTFLHADGIGTVTERLLWAQGVASWEDYAGGAPSLPLSAAKRAALTDAVAASRDALAAGRVDYFARALPAREHWRAASHFPRLGYLDIETDGGYDRDAITLIGLSDGYETRLYTKGIDLEEFAGDCAAYHGFVTFFGGGFDVPFLKRRFPALSAVFAERLHLDLCPLLKTLGYRGGLKSIERQLGIQRRPEADGLSGLDAVRLWRAYQRGGEQAQEALRLLHIYNEEDVVNMKLLLDFALPRLRARAGMPAVAGQAQAA